MARRTNPCGKMTTYATFENSRTGWTWEVLKLYQVPEIAAGDQYARVMCRVSSPFTFGGSDMGDCYLADLLPQWGVCDTRTVGAAMTEWLQRFDAALDPRMRAQRAAVASALHVPMEL